MGGSRGDGLCVAGCRLRVARCRLWVDGCLMLDTGSSMLDAELHRAWREGHRVYNRQLLFLLRYIIGEKYFIRISKDFNFI